MAWQQTIYSNIDPGERVTGILWQGINDPDGDNDEGGYLWYDSLDWDTDGYGQMWVITSTPGYEILVGDNYATGYWYSYNGQRYWEHSGDYLWNYPGYGWVISSRLGSCVAESWDEDAGEYVGDSWWDSPALEGRYRPRGSNRGSTQGEYDWDASKTIFWSVKGPGGAGGAAYVRKPGDSLNSVQAPAGRYTYIKRGASIAGSEFGTVNETVWVGDIYLIVGTPVYDDEGNIESITYDSSTSNIYIANTALWV